MNNDGKFLDISIPSPATILDVMEGFRRSKCMFAAVSLGVFDLLDQPQYRSSGLTHTEVASILKLHSGATETLLNACVSLGLLTYLQPRYQNSPEATTYLCRSSPHRMTGYINYSNDAAWQLWGNLEDAVREGSHRWKQTFGSDGPIFSSFFRTDEAMNEFLMGMHGFGTMTSPHVVAAFDLAPFQKLVDLGGATGHLAMAACARYPSLHGIVLDLPHAIGLAKSMVEASPVKDRLQVVGGDFFTDPLPPADLYALGRILHDWDEEKIDRLLAKIYAALPEGGGLLIAEKVLFEEKTGPRSALLQSLNMLVCTEGRERSFSEYSGLLKKAGFRSAQCSRTTTPIDAILARK
jgi:acetylserotonin O-methyltransferase